jgi:hypothetical protein
MMIGDTNNACVIYSLETTATEDILISGRCENSGSIDGLAQTSDSSGN